MKDNNTVDINGSIQESVQGAFRHALGIVIVLIMFGFLFAPAFTNCFRPAVERKYGVNNFTAYPKIAAEMARIRLMLWGVAIVGWVLVICAYFAGYAN